MCAYTEKKTKTRKQGGRKKKNLCFTDFIWISGFTKQTEELSTLQYRIIGVLWDSGSFATVQKRGRLTCTDLNPTRRHRTAEICCQFIRLYFLNTVIYRHHSYLYVCSDFSVFLRSRTGRNMLMAFITPLCITIALFYPFFVFFLISHMP